MHSFVLSRLALSLLLMALASCVSAPRVQYDVLIRNGTVLDGAGNPRYRADIGVTGGRIAQIGDLRGATGVSEIDAAGLFVAPGFINLHSHPIDAGLEVAANTLTQGVTTEITNPDGHGPIDLDAQLSFFESKAPVVNVGGYIGFGSVWESVMGKADRRPTQQEIERMRELTTRGLQAGAWGVSGGLDYKPSYFAKVDEVIAALAGLGQWRTNFPNHDRLTPETRFSSRAGMLETLAIGEQAGLVPVFTHMKLQGAEQGGAATMLATMEETRKRGVYVAADVYPYVAGFTGLSALLMPAWSLEGGREATLTRLQDPVQRAKIAEGIEYAIQRRLGGPEGVFVVGPDRNLPEIMRELHVSAGEAVIREVETDFGRGAVMRFGAEEDMVKLLRDPYVAIACDCGPLSDPSTLLNRHPRGYGTFPRVLGRYVREQSVLSWEEAVRKMTGLPAAMIGMVDRGLLAPGMRADITIFDPKRIVDRATYAAPTEYSEGVVHVLVNGRAVLMDGKLTGARAGRVLRRSFHMPSRPMTTQAPGQLSGRALLRSKDTEGTAAEYEVQFQLTQSSVQTPARGTLTLVDGRSGQRMQIRDFGFIQKSKGWASVTGSGRRPDGAPIGLTLIVDEIGGDSPANKPLIVLDVDGLPLLHSGPTNR